MLFEIMVIIKGDGITCIIKNEKEDGELARIRFFIFKLIDLCNVIKMNKRLRH